MPVEIPQPWLGFLSEIDQTLDRQVTAHCFGGFVMVAVWKKPLPTSDLDVLDMTEHASALTAVAGKGTVLSGKYRLWVQVVHAPQVPSEYESRLLDITPSSFKQLKLMAFEAHDLVLSKLIRWSQRDREDAEFLRRAGALDLEVLKERFDEEFLPYFALNEDRVRMTMDLCLKELRAIGADGG